MPNSAKLKKQLVQMWRDDPKCHWCGKITALSGGADNLVTSDTATLDHLYSRRDPRRKEVNRTMEKRRLLACYECNQKRNQEEVALQLAENARRRELAASGIQTVFD